MPLGRVPEPFSDADWLCEIKWDGFRALLHSDKDGVRLVSRNGNVFKSFPGLCEGFARDLKGRKCVLDGEIVSLDSAGNSKGDGARYSGHIVVMPKWYACKSWATASAVGRAVELFEREHEASPDVQGGMVTQWRVRVLPVFRLLEEGLAAAIRLPKMYVRCTTLITPLGEENH